MLSRRAIDSAVAEQALNSQGVNCEIFDCLNVCGLDGKIDFRRCGKG